MQPPENCEQHPDCRVAEENKEKRGNTDLTACKKADAAADQEITGSINPKWLGCDQPRIAVFRKSEELESDLPAEAKCCAE
ncbi:MAG: hypothetical protein ACTFAL_00390 [Candidatus Electronema sp. V4]|uniref:hypothetical protein n=1 Tax=Candidatus Electronema sp. V4 TaxID=3454756 RepID=UPI0040554767